MVQFMDKFPPINPDDNTSLRDWFAGMALSGLLADSAVKDTPQKIAEVSYVLADAMLAARSRT